MKRSEIYERVGIVSSLKGLEFIQPLDADLKVRSTRAYRGRKPIPPPANPFRAKTARRGGRGCTRDDKSKGQRALHSD